MIKGKIILAVILYAILGVIALFNFGLCDHLLQNPERSSLSRETTWVRMGNQIRNARAVVPKSYQDSLAGHEDNE